MRVGEVASPVGVDWGPWSHAPKVKSSVSSGTRPKGRCERFGVISMAHSDKQRVCQRSAVANIPVSATLGGEIMAGPAFPRVMRDVPDLTLLFFIPMRTLGSQLEARKKNTRAFSAV